MLFFAYFSVSKKRNIKRSPNGMKPSGTIFFGTNANRETWSGRQATNEAVTRVGPPRARPLPRGPPVAPVTYSFLLYIPTYPQTNRTGAKNLIPPPQLSVSTTSHLGAYFGALAEGASTMEGFYINTIAPPMKSE